jgi:transcriptional regulator with XRE-family HTH domain
MADELAPKLGAYLKKLRIAKGLTLAEAADGAGLAPSHLFYSEEGKRRQPRPEYLHRLARFYGVLVEDLFALAGYTPTEALPELGAYLRSKYPDLSEEAVREISDFTDFLTERDQ